MAHAPSPQHQIVILGGGTGGTLVANRLRDMYPRDQAEITIVDQDDLHVYQPGLLFVPFGLSHPEDIVRPRRRQLHDGIELTVAPIDHVDIDTQVVHLAGGPTLPYDVLVVATGARLLVPEETEGLLGPGLDAATSSRSTTSRARRRSRRQLAHFDGGRIVVNVVDMPIKCPVAPLEFCFLADWFFTRTRHTQLGRAHLRDTARRRIHQAGGFHARSAVCSRRKASSWSPSSTPAKSTARPAAWSRTTAGKCRSTSRSSCRCTAAPPTSAGRPGSATSSTSCRPTSTRCSRRRGRTCS